MDAFSDPAIEQVVVMSSSQMGKTEILLNVVGYYIDKDPSPVMIIQPTLEMALSWSKDRLSPMLRDTPCLKGTVKDPRSRDSGNTLLHKTFKGGHITMAGANSPASLASRPIRIVLCDEVDKYSGEVKNNEPEKHPEQRFFSLDEIKKIAQVHKIPLKIKSLG